MQPCFLFDKELWEGEWALENQVIEAKDQAVRGLMFEEASLLRDREQELWERVAKMGEMDADLAGSYVGEVDVAEIERVASLWTGIPLEQLSEDEVERLSGLEDILHERVVGQQDAVRCLPRRVYPRFGIRTPNCPVPGVVLSVHESGHPTISSFGCVCD